MDIQGLHDYFTCRTVRSVEGTLFLLFNLDASEISKTVLNLLFFSDVSKLWAEYAEFHTNKVFLLHGNSFLMWRRSLVIRDFCLQQFLCSLIDSHI